MSKHKKKTPKINLRLLARPRLDALFERRARGELDDDGLYAAVQSLMDEDGYRPAIDALVKRMAGASDAERETLMILIPRLRHPEVIDYLWHKVKKPGALPLDAKMTALVILKEMGEDVDLSDTSRYFPTRDFKRRDIKTAQGLFRTGIRGLANDLRNANDPAEVEAMMLHLRQIPGGTIDSEDLLLEMTANIEADADDLGADFLFALMHTTSFPQVRQATERALARLAANGVKPVTPAILGLGQDKFYAAYMTDPNQPWQQNVIVAYERGGGVIQALSFLLDFGVPWRGAIKDMFATRGMAPSEFQSKVVEKWGGGARLYRVRLDRVQATIAAALKTNRASKIPLPKEFNEISHLVERWAQHPSAEALAADTTRDELGDRPLIPDRSGQPILMHAHDLEHLDEIMSGNKVPLPPDEDEAFFEET